VRRLFFVLALSTLISCDGPQSSDAPRAEASAVPLEARLTKIADVPEGPHSYSLECVDHTVCGVSDAGKLWRTDDGGKHWTLIYSNERNGEAIATVRFIDSQKAWLLTSNKIYRSQDGKTSIEEASPLPGAGEVSSIEFLENGNVGWVGGGVYRPVKQEEVARGLPNNVYDVQSQSVLQSALARTNDGGKTWVQQKLPPVLGRVLGLKFVNESHGLAITSGGIFVTTDGGNQWQPVSFKRECTDQKYLEGYDWRPLQPFFLDEKNVWLTWADGRITKSLDGGKTWCDLVTAGAIKFNHYDAYFKEIAFVDANHGIGLGANRLVYETTDGGKTWSQTLNTQFDDMDMVDKNTVWLISKLGLFQMNVAHI